MMKTIRFLTITLVLATFTVFSADAKNKPDSPEQLLRDKISELVRKPDLKLVPIHEREVTVEFIITHDNKVVVLDVDTYNAILEKYIKEKLNYQKISVKGVRKMMPYRIKLSFVVRG